jgi:hypothetical protein
MTLGRRLQDDSFAGETRPQPEVTFQLASLQDFAASMPATGGTHCRRARVGEGQQEANRRALIGVVAA